MYSGWKLKDLSTVSPNSLKVFSFFSCGGGSSMGYKLAGYEVIGNCEIDKKIAHMYQKNHNPLYSYNMDIRDFLLQKNEDLPDELFNLDILDGSPPCSVFSMAGKREDNWGKSKHFREGQVAQVLDDLFFEYVKAVDKLAPKVFVAENVKGILFGNAKGYVTEILKAFDKIGYVVQLFCLNSANMGVPQRRERVFFVGHRKELNYSKLQLEFNEQPILFGDIRDEGGKAITEYSLDLLKHKRTTDNSLADINKRMYQSGSRFNAAIVWDYKVAPTITASGEFYKACNDKTFTDEDFINCQTFPQDYNFCGMNTQYVCGMSVPPIMMKCIATKIMEQWFLKNDVQT